MIIRHIRDSRWVDPIRARRWRFKIRRWRVGFVHEVQWFDSETWHESSTFRYEIMLGPPFLLGLQHVYYDGPNCSLSLGWIHLCWCGIPPGHCRKCMPSTGKVSRGSPEWPSSIP